MDNKELNSSLEFIGIRVQGDKAHLQELCDIEEIIYVASLEVEKDSRLFSLLCSWVQIHGGKVIIEKLMKKQKKNFSPWLVAIAIFAESVGLHQWKRLIVVLKKELFFVEKSLAESQISRKGAFPGMKERNILIAENEIRVRATDIYSKEELVRTNRQYRNRFLYGACIRSDVITMIQEGTPNPYQIAKRIGCSQGPAYRIFKEYELVKSVGAA